jgi:hypothetical protein
VLVKLVFVAEIPQRVTVLHTSVKLKGSHQDNLHRTQIQLFFLF